MFSCNQKIAPRQHRVMSHYRQEPQIWILCILYPLVNVYITMDKSFIFDSSTIYKWPFLIAMLVITRGYVFLWIPNDPVSSLFTFLASKLTPRDYQVFGPAATHKPIGPRHQGPAHLSWLRSRGSLARPWRKPPPPKQSHQPGRRPSFAGDDGSQGKPSRDP